MKFIISIFTIAFLLIMLACEQLKVPGENTPQVQVVENSGNYLIINEVCAKGNDENEFGRTADWIELYNASSTDIQIEPGEWTISDDPANPEKFVIPYVLVPAGSFLVLWCDGDDRFDSEIHTNFKLSAGGESIGLYHHGEQIEQITFGETTESGNSYGRTEDGQGKWILFEHGSPGMTNQQLLSDHD